MEEYTHLKNAIARNIAEHRKAMGLTQAELAEKLNYTDKAVSKWERAEAVPDVFILKQLADLFGITLDELTSTRVKKVWRNITRKKVLIPMLSALLVWLVTAVAFMFLSVFEVPVERLWLAFVYAIPASVVVLLVFNIIWGKQILTAVLVSLLVWSIAVSLYITFVYIKNMGFLFIIAGVLQLMTVLWYLLTRRKIDGTSSIKPQP
jgi:transcriptional regulator with XRE-family HTH domain